MRLIKSCLLLLLITILISSCNKIQENTTTQLMNSMLVGKTWYLEYSMTGSNTKSYVGQITYFITFYKDGTTVDSDGITGRYSLNFMNGKYNLQVEAKSVNGNTLNYTHEVESIGSINMVQSYVPYGQTTKITQYYSSK